MRRVYDIEELKSALELELKDLNDREVFIANPPSSKVILISNRATGSINHIVIEYSISNAELERELGAYIRHYSYLK